MRRTGYSFEPVQRESVSAERWLADRRKTTGQGTRNYQEAIELIPQEAQLYQERGRVHLLMGDKAGAAEDMKKAIELAPEKENLISGNFNNFEKSNLQTGIY